MPAWITSLLRALMPDADALGRLEDQRLASAERKLARDRQSHDARADDHRFDVIHSRGSVARAPAP